MNVTRLHRSLDLTIISGIIKCGFFSKGKPFELYLYHTRSRRLFDHKIIGASLKELRISVKVGDSVDSFRNWAAAKGHDIEEHIR